MDTPKTIVITAYAVNPFKGSEDGTGWNITREVANDYQVILITRKNNVPHVLEYFDKFPEQSKNIEVHGYDLPETIMNFKKKLGERGYVLYYYFWQWGVARFIKQKNFRFDIAHSLNFHSDSHPNFLWRLGKPVIHGPLGHHPRVSDSFLKFYGRNSAIKDRLYYYVKTLMRKLDPFYHKSIKKTFHLFGINSSIRQTTGIESSKFSVLPAVACEDNGLGAPPKGQFNILSVGRFHYMKGFDLAIGAFHRLLKNLSAEEAKMTKLYLIGKGEEKVRLINFAKQLGIQEKIEWVDWVERDEMKKIYQNSHLFLFPSHEGAGMVVPEAMSYGIPVVCGDNFGPGELIGETGIKVELKNPEQAIKALAMAMTKLVHQPELRAELGLKSRKRFEQHFTWRKKGDAIKAVYDKALERSIAVFHPSSELYGADRILVNALQSLPAKTKKRVYLKFEGPLHDFLKENVQNVEIIQRPDLPIIYRKLFTPRGIIKFGVDYVRFAHFFKKEHRRYQFRSAYINTLATSLLLPWLSHLKLPAYSHVHEIIEKPWVVGKITAWLALKYSSVVICVSNAVRNNLKNYVPNRINKAVVLHNGIDMIRAEAARPNEVTQFYLFGRITPNKGQWYLIEALKKLSVQTLRKAHFTLIGGTVNGQEHLLDDLKYNIENHGLSPYISIKGFTANITQHMSQAHFCLVPSMFRDPFPTTVLEALSAGRGVLATNHGGAKEMLIENENGLLIDPNDPLQFAERLDYLINHPQLIGEMGRKGYESFVQNYSKKIFSENWLTMSKKYKLI
jgi:glycosyltransferase involved in cell wall biosynthesis